LGGGERGMSHGIDAAPDPSVADYRATSPAAPGRKGDAASASGETFPSIRRSGGQVMLLPVMPPSSTACTRREFWTFFTPLARSARSSA